MPTTDRISTENNLQIWICLSELWYQIPQLCKCKCCEVSWNWLNCRVIMFCTPVRDYLTGGLPKQLLDKLVLNRCPKLILQVWKFVEKGGKNKTENKVGFLYLFGSRGRKGHQRIWVIHTFFILQSSLLFLVWQLSGQSAKFPPTPASSNGIFPIHFLPQGFVKVKGICNFLCNFRHIIWFAILNWNLLDRHQLWMKLI